MKFNVKNESEFARRAELDFPRGKIQTPAFMPVGTNGTVKGCLLYTSPSPRDKRQSRMPSSA